MAETDRRKLMTTAIGRGGFRQFGVEGYSVNSVGEVWSEKRNKLLIPQCKYGYKVVGLSNKGIKLYRSVARLVAFAFVPNPENKPTVNHKGGDRANNDVSNLEWATSKEQAIHRNRVLGHNPTIEHMLKMNASANTFELRKRHSKRMAGAGNSRARPITQLDLSGEVVKHYDYSKRAAQENGINVKTIRKCCNGKIKSYKGYVWRWASA